MSLRNSPGGGDLAPLHLRPLSGRMATARKSYPATRENPVSLHAFDGPDMADQIFETHRPRLTALAYRMLGSHADAEDAVQDVWLRWRKQDHDTINDATGWLVRVCSNICLDVLKSARRQRENYVGNWLPEPWVPVEEPKAEQNLIEQDGLGQAYLLMLERLAPVERVALVLHEVFDWVHDDIAPVIERTPNNTRQILFRARRKMQRDDDRDPTPDPKGQACEQSKIEAFIKALSIGDVSQLVSQLAPDVIMHSDGGGKASAALNPVFGAMNVARFFVGVWGKREPGARIFYLFDARENWLLMTVDGKVVTGISASEHDGKLVDVFVHRNPDKLELFEPLLCDAVEVTPDTKKAG